MNEAGTQKIDSINRILARAVIFAAVTVWFFQTFTMTPDLHWQLAAGRDICQRGYVPHTDDFSYTFQGKEWINHEWLWEVGYWKVYEIGPDAVAWLTIALIVAAFTLYYLLAYQICGSVFCSGVAVWLAAATTYWYLDVRPHILTLLLVSIVLVTRDWKRAPWFWPPLILLWANLHAGFVFGIGTIGLLVLMRTLEQSWRARKPAIPWGQWFSVLACLVVWMVNPFGWKIIEFQLSYFLHDSPYKNLVEWKPPEFGLDPTYYEGSFFWLSALALAGMFLDRKHWYLICLSLVTFYLAVGSRRFILLFAVVATPFVAVSVLRARTLLETWIPALKSAWAALAATIIAAAVAASMWSHVSFQTGLLRQWIMGDVFPEDAVEYLNALGPPQRVLNYYIWGGLIMLDAPGAKVFMDGRANTLYDDNIYRDDLDLTWGEGTIGLDQLDKYKPDVALLPSTGLAARLQALNPPWQEIYRDSLCSILAPPDSLLLSRSLPDPNAVLTDRVESYIKDAFDTLDRHDYPGAIAILEEALRKYPYSIRCYALLARIYAARGEFDRLDPLIADAIRDNPRQANNLYLQLALTYQEFGRLRPALEAYKLCRPKGPFTRRDDHEQMIESVENRIAAQGRGL